METNHPKTKISKRVYFMCGWPLILVFVGGAIGGGLGGAAFGINFYIYQSKLPVIAKIILNLLVGLCAIVIWVIAATLIQSRLGHD
ncbi:MAG: hypothetical protein AB7S78_01265 [Candidatus Omnitrophota bacterium]